MEVAVMEEDMTVMEEAVAMAVVVMVMEAVAMERDSLNQISNWSCFNRWVLSHSRAHPAISHCCHWLLKM